MIGSDPRSINSMILPHSIHHSHPLLHTRSDSNPTDNTTQVIVGVVVGGVAVIASMAFLIFQLVSVTY